MIRSVFRRGIPHRLLFLTVLFICHATFFIVMTRGYIPKEIVPGALMPDAAFGGYSPQQARAWYESLDDTAMILVLFLGLVDILGITPSYTLFLGSQLAASSDCPDVFCYVPLWTASFDLMESLTHFMAVLGRYLSNDRNDTFWSPSTFHLVIASAATQFKMMTFIVSLLLVAFYGLRSTRPTPKKSS